jgi:hypothetical protein
MGRIFCCAGSRNEESSTNHTDTEKLPLYANNSYLIDNFKTENINDDSLKEVFCKACNEENLLVILVFYQNNSILSYDLSTYIDLDKLWMDMPETLSDLAAYKIYCIVSDKISFMKYNQNDNINKFIEQIKQINLIQKLIVVISVFTGIEYTPNFENKKDKKNSNNDNNYNLNNSNNTDNKKNELIEKNMNDINVFNNGLMYSKNYFGNLKDPILTTQNNCKLDYTILTLTKISNFKQVSELYNNIYYFDFLLEYISSLRLSYYIKNKEHTIVTLELLRNIYITNYSFRKRFISHKGLDTIIYHLENSRDIDILQEIAYSIQDLIYKTDEEIENCSTIDLGEDELNEIYFKDIIIILKSLNFENVLMKFLTRHKLGREFKKVSDIIGNMVVIFNDVTTTTQETQKSDDQNYDSEKILDKINYEDDLKSEC